VRWLLPPGIEDLLPPQAEALEQARRRLLDLFSRWGYRLVMPPLVEYADALLTGTGADLAQQTLQVTDPASTSRPRWHASTPATVIRRRRGCATSARC
jgi:ATP phosphoribosyltransferase regulatory subunit